MRLSVGLAVLVAFLVGCAHTAAQIMETRLAATPVRSALLFRHAMLDGQNAARAAAGVPPLVWDVRLAADAAAYAATMASTGRFQHAVQPMDAHREGENLWTGTRGAYPYADMVGGWVAEGHNFVNAPTPNFSRTGRWQDVGHYTQIVWRRTTAVGCGIASSATDDYVVCRYGPPGNVVGQTAF